MILSADFPIVDARAIMERVDAAPQEYTLLYCASGYESVCTTCSDTSALCHNSPIPRTELSFPIVHELAREKGMNLCVLSVDRTTDNYFKNRLVQTLAKTDTCPPVVLLSDSYYATKRLQNAKPQYLRWIALYVTPKEWSKYHNFLKAFLPAGHYDPETDEVFAHTPRIIILQKGKGVIYAEPESLEVLAIDYRKWLDATLTPVLAGPPAGNPC